MNKKILSFVAAAAIAITAAGCGAKDTMSSVVPTQGPSVLSSGTTFDTVVVEFEGNADMNVTFGDFLKEYKYYLAGYQITDDSVEPYVSMLSGQREYIVNYLVNERIMEKKFAELGLTLTDEDNKQIEQDTQSGIENMKNTFKNRVQLASGGEALSAEELTKRAEEEYNKMLTDCGLTEEDLKNWQRSIYIQQKLTDHLNAGFVYEYSEAEKEVQTIIADAKAAYEKDNSDYDPDALKSLYIPDGSRYVQHILLKFDDATTTQISQLRQAGSNADADKLREEKIAAMSAEIAEVESKVASGEDFSALMVQYSDDGDKTASYLVAPGTTMYMDGFAECALGISQTGGTDTVVTDYGWHIIKYTEAAVVTEESIKGYTDALHEYLEDAYKTQKLNESMAAWREELTYTVDREILMLSEEESTTSAQ